MKHVLAVICIALLILSITTYGQTPLSSGISEPQKVAGFALFPREILYQGLLTTSSGAPATDGSYTLQFDLFSVLAGGSSLWTETQSGVNVQKGTFSVRLGSVTPLPNYFYEELYVEVTATAGPGIGGSIVFSPRTKLAASPYSLGPWLSSSYDIYFPYGNVGVGTSTPSYRYHQVGGDHVIQDADISLARGIYHRWRLQETASSGLRIRQVYNDSQTLLNADRFEIADNGNIGIGMANPDPYTKLHVKTGGSGNLDNVTIESPSASVGFGLKFVQPNRSWAIGQNIGNFSDGRFQIFDLTAIGARFTILSNGNVGIGTGNPLSTTKLHVESNNRYAGYFDSDSAAGINTHVVHAEYTGTGNNDASAVWGDSRPADGYGYGGYFQGGYRGVFGFADAGAYAGSSFGVYGIASGTAGFRYGVIGTASGGTTNYAVYASGDLAYTGSLINASDAKLKENVASLSGTLSRIMQVKSRMYDYRSGTEFSSMSLSSGKHYGFVAQELEEVFPELVVDVVHPGDDPANKVRGPEIHYKGVKYMEMVPILVKAIQEQQQMIDKQQKEIDELKALISLQNK